MKKTSLLIILMAALLLPSGLYAQKKGAAPAQNKGHLITFTIPKAKDQKVYLAVYYREKLILKDSAFRTESKAGPQFIFKGDEAYQGGLYKLVSETHFPYMDFIMDGPQFMSFECGVTGSADSVIVHNSPQNDELMAFQRKTTAAGKQMSEYRRLLDEAKKNENQADIDKYEKLSKDLNQEMEDYIQNLIDRNPTYLFSKMQKAYQSINVPDPPTNPDGSIDSTFQLRYYLTHYWDNIDLGDSRFIFTPLFEPKLKDYFDRWLQYQEPDSINHYIDLMLARAEADTLMFHYLIDWLSYHYETSKVLGHDGVFVHIVKENHMKGKCTWMDEDLLRKYEKRVKHLDPILIGRQSQELIIPDTTLTDDFTKWHSSYRLPKKYVILWFYDPDCPTCKKESKKLRAVYDSLENLGQRNFDVYAVANDADIDRWKKYVKENNYPWINVGGNKGNVDYLEAYNIYESGNPAMFILNERREIILNRRIEMDTIPEFLRQYEKRQALKH
jgi:peroxiredoxin